MQSPAWFHWSTLERRQWYWQTLRFRTVLKECQNFRISNQNWSQSNYCNAGRSGGQSQQAPCQSLSPQTNLAAACSSPGRPFTHRPLPHPLILAIVGHRTAWDRFYEEAYARLNKTFPQRKVTVTSADPHFITPNAKLLLRRKSRLLSASRIEEAEAAREKWTNASSGWLRPTL